MDDSPGAVGPVILLFFVLIALLTLLYWLHRSAIRKLRGDLSDKDMVIRELRQKYFDLRKRYMTANGGISRNMKYEMENLSAKLDMLKDPMEEFRTRVEDIERDIEKLTKHQKGDER